MVTFEVNDMTCGHCANSISKAVGGVDKGAKVQIDLASHRVHIEPSVASTEQLSCAIGDAGYTAVVIDGTARPAAPRRSGCCCG